MKVLDNWGVLISQTGSEVIAISEKLGILPSLIVTNNITKISPRNMEIFGGNNVEIHSIPRKPSIVDYLRTRINLKELITLHGYLRILPADLFPYLQGGVYNGHPGLILTEKYPELKGKDPQEKVWLNMEKYTVVGSVVHKCIPELDAGEIVAFEEVKNTAQTKEQLYTLLANTSLTSWRKFFTEIYLF
jgi:folate-dependent phosphoribosylglycinamide formyltransferase PurN